MATNSRQELDKKTKKLSSSGRIELGKEHAAYQETLQQLLAIQAERQQNLALARAESKADSNLNQTLAQAAELGAVSAAEAEQAAMAGLVQTLNPATQAVLSKYGMGQPRILRSSFQNRQVTRQNVTINNNTTVTTKNDVNVPTGGGPIQGRPVQFKTPSQQDSAGRFKSWLSSAFARQKEEGERRDREYRHRESSLTKSASRMMKKLEDIGKTIGTRLDPRKIGSTWQSQLKTLLFLFGFGYLASNWVKILGKIDSISEWIKGTWEYFTDDSKGETGFTSKLKRLLGGNSNESLAESFGNLLIGNDGLWGLMKAYFDHVIEDRSNAVKAIKFPDLDITNAIDSIKSIGIYLGDILTAMVGGTSSVKPILEKQATSEALSTSLNYANNHNYGGVGFLDSGSGAKLTVTVGDYKGDAGALSILDGSYKGLTHYSLDESGKLDKNNLTEATISAASEVARIKSDIDNNNDISGAPAAAYLLQQLYNTSKETSNNLVAVPRSFLEILSKDEIQKLYKEKKLIKSKYHVAYVEKSDRDFNRENLNPERRGWESGVNTYALNRIVGFNDTLSKAAGVLQGGIEGGLTGIDKYFSNDGRFILTKRLVPGIMKDTGETRDVYEISPKGLEAIAKKMTGTDNVDLNDLSSTLSNLTSSIVDNLIKRLDELKSTAEKNLEELYRKVGSGEENEIIDAEILRKENAIKDIEKYKASIRDQQNSGYTEYAKTLDDLDKKTLENDARFEAATSNNRLYRAEGEWKSTFVDPIKGLATNIGGRLINISASKGNVDSDELKYRKKYLMKVLTEKGLSKAAAAGIIGNLEGEGLKNKTDDWHEDPSKEHKDGRSVGIAQFHNYGMFPALEKWAKERGRRWEDFETLADFIAEHAVTKKIANLTKNLSPQDSLKKSAIIWGRDFEVFKGHDAADKNYNIVGRGARNSSGQYGDQNYANRIKMGLTTYNNYSNENLDSITLQTGGESDGPVIPGTVDQRWVMCVNDVTKWYNKSIPTYNGGNGSPKYYKSKWGNVRDDCSGLVSACISAYLESSFDSDSTNLSFKDNEIGKKLEGAGFGYIKFTSWGALKPYDIIVSQGHTEIYAGNINGLECSFSWGSLHNTKTNPSGPPWPSDKSKEYKVIWRNGSGSGPDFMYNNGIKSSEKDDEPTSFLSIMFSSITESLKNFSQGLAASNNDVVSAFGKGFGELVEKAELIVGKTEEVKDEIKNKKLPDPKTINNTSTSNVKMDLNNLTEKDYTLLRELVKSHTTNGIVDIGGFTKELNDKYGIDLKKWYLTGDVEKKRQLIKNLFGFDPYSNNLTIAQSNIISGLELPKPSFGGEYLDYQLVTNGGSVLPHIGTDFAATSIDNFKFSTDSLFAPPVLNKDTSFIDEVNKNREETSVALQDNATLTARTIAGATDYLANVMTQNTQTEVNAFRGSSNKGGLDFVKVDSSINQTEAYGIG